MLTFFKTILMASCGDKATQEDYGTKQHGLHVHFLTESTTEHILEIWHMYSSAHMQTHIPITHIHRTINTDYYAGQ
jgi:hypothetical protein